MSTTIDQRVVEMQFNNAEFERNVSQTINSVDNLKESLDFGGLDSGLDTVASAVGQVSLKFSALESVAVGALMRIGDQAVTAGERLIKSLSIDQITSGYAKYEQKTASVQSLINSTGEDIETVNGYLDKLMWFSDETSYSFTDMTSALATMSSSGGDVKDLIPLIEGVANATAFAGKSTSEFTRTMYNLNQSYSAGYLTYMDWKSVQQAGVASKQLIQTFIDMGVALGKIEEGQVTVENFATTLSEKWADTEVMEAAFGKFSEMTEAAYELIEAGEYDTATEAYAAIADQFDEISAKAAKSAQEAKTFTEAIVATKDAVSSKWLTSFETIFGNYDEAKSLWTDLSEELYDIFAEPLNEQNNMLSEALGDKVSVTREEFQSLIDTGVDGIPELRKVLVSAGQAAGAALDGAADSSSAFLDSLESGWLTADIFHQAFDSVWNETLNVATGFETVSASLEELDAIARRVIQGEFGTGADRMEQLAEAGWDYATVQNAVNQILSGSEVTLADVSDAQLVSMGYTEEQIAMLKELATQAAETNTPLGELMSSMTRPSGRDNLLTAFWTGWDNIREILGTVKSAFREVFPATTAEQVYALTESLITLAEKFKMGDDNLANLKRTCTGLFSILDLGWQIIKAVIGGISSLLSVVSSASGGVLEFTGNIGDWISGIDQAAKESQIFQRIVQKIVDVIKIALSVISAVWNGLLGFASAVKEAGGNFASAFSDKFDLSGLTLLQSLLSSVKTRIVDIRESTDGLTGAISAAFQAASNAILNSRLLDILSTLWEIVKKVLNALSSALGSLAGAFMSGISSGNFSGFWDMINALSGSALVVALGALIKKLGTFTITANNTISSVQAILAGVQTSVNAFTASIKSKTLLTIASAIAILAAALIALTLIDSDKLSGALAAVTAMFGELAAFMMIFSDLNSTFGKGDKKGTGVEAAINALIPVTVAVLLLAAAMKKLSGLNITELAAGAAGITILLGELVGVMAVMTKLSNSMVVAGGAQLKSFSAMAKALIPVVEAVLILSLAMKLLANMDITELVKGVGTVTVLLGEMTGIIAAMAHFSGGMDKVQTKGITSMAKAMIPMAAAVAILAVVLKSLGSMDISSLAKGAAGITVLLGELSGVSVAMSKFSSGSDSFGSGAGMILMATSIVILAQAIKTFGTMDIPSLSKGLGTITVLLGELSLALNLMKGTAGAAASLLIIAAAMTMLIAPMVAFGAMSWENLAKGAALLAGMFLIIGVAGAVLTPVVPTILALAGALTLIGVAAVASGAGLVLIGAGLSAIAVGIASLTSSLAVGGAAIASGAVSIIKSAIQGLAEGFLLICQTIVEGAPAIAEAIHALLAAGLSVLTENAPQITIGLMQFCITMLDSLIEYTPQIVAKLASFIVALFRSLGEYIPEIVAAGLEMFAAVFRGIFEALGNYDTGDLIQALLAVGMVAGLIAALNTIVPMIPLALVGLAGVGAIIAEMVLIFAAIGQLGQIEGIAESLDSAGDLMQGVGSAIGQFVGGLVGGIAEGVMSALPGIATSLSECMTNLGPFIEGASSIDSGILESVAALAGAIIALTAAEVISGLTSWFTGGSTLLTFGTELSEFGPLFRSYADAVAGMDSESVKVSAEALRDFCTAAGDIPNEGGVVSWFTGDNSLAAFGPELEAFGPSFAAYADSISGVSNWDDVAVSATALKDFCEAAAQIPDEGGLLSVFVGDNSLSKFGTELVAFAPSFVDYADAISGTSNWGSVKTSATALKDFCEAAAQIPNEGGVVSWFTGDNSLADFGAELEDFGPGFAAYADAVGDVEDWDAVASSAEALQKFCNLSSSNIPELGELSLSGFAKAFTDGEDSTTDAVVQTFTTIIMSAEDEIRSHTQEFEDLGGTFVTSFCAGIQNETDDSDIGLYVVQGLADGITDNSSIASNAATKLASSMITAMQDKLIINSPSVAARDEVGRYIVQGVAEGIESDMSAEEAATQKAQNIISAFQEVLDKMDIQSEIADLELELWQAMNPDATVSEQETMQLNRYYDAIYGSNGKIEAATAAYAEYLAVAHELGEEDQTTLEYKQKYLQAVLDVNDAISTYNDYAAEEIENNKTAQESYDELLASWKTADSLTIKNSAGVITEVLRGQDEIQARWEYLESLAKEATGYDPDAITELDQIDAATVLSEIVNAATNVYEQNADTIIASVLAASTAYASETAGATSSMVNAMSAGSTVSGAAIGTTMANAISSGIQNGGSTVTSTVDSLLTSCTTTMNDDYSDWVQVGGYLVDGFIAGIRAKQAEAAAAAAAMAAAARSAASVEISVNSPSKDFADIGMYADLGMAQGLEDYTDTVTTASAAMAKSGLDGVTKVVSQINAMMDDEGAYAPTIAPVVDLTGVNRSAREIGGLFQGETLDVSANVRSAQYTGYLNDSRINETSGNAASGGNSYTFNQNNYSPKSLSRIEIYRQTKNLFSTLKGVNT